MSIPSPSTVAMGPPYEQNKTCVEMLVGQNLFHSKPASNFVDLLWSWLQVKLCRNHLAHFSSIHSMQSLYMCRLNTDFKPLASNINNTGGSVEAAWHALRVFDDTLTNVLTNIYLKAVVPSTNARFPHVSRVDRLQINKHNII